MKYEIVHLQTQSHGYKMRQTDFDLMDLEAAFAIAAELTTDAIEADRDDRWTLIPVSYNGRPFRPYT